MELHAVNVVGSACCIVLAEIELYIGRTLSSPSCRGEQELLDGYLHALLFRPSAFLNSSYATTPLRISDICCSH